MSFLSLQNTVRTTNFALRAYQSFAATQRIDPSNPHAVIFAKPLTEQSVKELITTVAMFVLGARKQKPSKTASAEPYAYPPSTLLNMVRSIDRHLREAVQAENALRALQDLPLKPEPKLLLDPVFQPVRNALDRRMKHLTRLGIGITKKQADGLTLAQEQVSFTFPLWSFRLFFQEELKT